MGESEWLKEGLVEEAAEGKKAETKAKPRKAGVKLGEEEIEAGEDRSDDEDWADGDGPMDDLPPAAADPVWDAERQNRESWTGKLDFILSCIGYAVGLGNVWRFPYLCYRSGGGAFLVPYFFFLVVCGMPLVMLEMSIGQFCSLSPTALYQKFCPLVQGIGWGMIVVSGVVCIYYNIIITWTLYYFYLSFRAVLPWTSCGNEWNDQNCVGGVGELNFNGTLNGTLNETLLAAANASGGPTKRQTASEQFWLNAVLSLSPGVEEMGSVRPPLVICLALAWVLIFACLFKGVKSSGRVVYVTATFPYCVLLILCIRGITLPGAWEGIKFYLVPKWSKLGEMSVWLDAASQIFYSVGAAWGALITMASYNRFRHNCYRDAIVIPLINCATSVFAGIVVFSIIGFMAHVSGVTVDKVITSGPGLAFIVYPEAVAHFPLAPLWAVLFFTMLLTIGVDSQFGMFETLISALVDTWPGTLRKRKVLLTGVFCFAMFLLGIPFVSQGGMYLLQLMDWYSATFSLMVISLIECLTVVYVYGHRRYQKDMELMIRRKPAQWWILCWGLVTPLIIGALLVLTLATHVPVSYNGYVYPGWAVGLGWGLASLSLLPIPGLALYHIVRAPVPGLWAKVLHAARPTADWGPSRLGDRVAFRKSFAQAPSRQLYVKGVERQAQEIHALSLSHTSYADLAKFNQDRHTTFQELRE